MHDRSSSPALSRVNDRWALHRLPWRALRVPGEAFSSQRARRIEARVAQVREHQMRRMISHGGRR